MRHTHSGNLPKHQYVWLQPKAIGDHEWLRAVWFGLVSYPGRAWGCHLLLESGAVYRDVPLHQLAFEKEVPEWSAEQAQTWDCYGYDFATLEYDYLQGMDVRARLRDRTEHEGRYLFTAVPIGDGFSAVPEQSKEFFFCGLYNGRITAQPTNQVLLEDRSFTTGLHFPTNLRRKTTINRCE